MTEKRFLQGLLAAGLFLGLVVLGLQLLFTRVGEIGLAGVIDRQLAAPNGQVLFLSGLNQNAHRYKLALLDRVRPEAVAIGSSRAMEVRSDFFTTSFVTMGGAVNNLENLEAVAAHLASSTGPKPRLALVFIDPWLFNGRYTDNQGPAPAFPKVVSADMIWKGAKAFRRGDWVSAAFRSPNLGIYALLNDEGYARDGSVYYTGSITGKVPPIDPRFQTTFGRINGDHQNFQRADHADPALVGRICRALVKIRGATGHVVVVAPPFASPVWRRLQAGDYGYIADGYAALRTCAADMPFFDFSNPATVVGGGDCEFLDGLHGGDVTYARMLGQIAAADARTRPFVREAAVRDFVTAWSGRAGGSVLAMNPAHREVDFLGLGCRKQDGPKGTV